MSNWKRITFYLLLLASGIAALIFANRQLGTMKAKRLPVIGEEKAHIIAPFSFVNQEGKVITNADVAGKINVVSYFFATCKGICPAMNRNLQKVYNACKGDKEIIFLSHTVDPKRDTVAALNAYGKLMEADPAQWMFLTGDKKKLYDMARYSYLISAGDDTTGLSIDADFIHDQQFTLVDGAGRIRGFYDGLDSVKVRQLILDIRKLKDEQ
ncbi:MAG: SCO family protein [Flavipsychrobacter sp.]|nr:SCO family protein [Flavipsychrobacter sp.]